jgi:hypothetical protein
MTHLRSFSLNLKLIFNWSTLVQFIWERQVAITQDGRLYRVYVRGCIQGLDPSESMILNFLST